MQKLSQLSPYHAGWSPYYPTAVTNFRKIRTLVKHALIHRCNKHPGLLLKVTALFNLNCQASNVPFGDVSKHVE